MNVASFATLDQVGVDSAATDREIWLRCQRDELLLLTANRNMRGDDSLEAVIRQLAGAESLPVLTLADADRILTSATYRELCAYRIAEIALDLKACRGITRMFIP